jgi:hypothetical protein
MSTNLELLKIIFLDIDGVLLTKKSHLLDSNLSIYNEMGIDKIENGREYHNQLLKYALEAEFDNNAIMLLNRLCEKTNARIVIHSNWRRSYKFDVVKNKLIKEGILEKHFHEDFYCRIRGMSSEKADDILYWLDLHRTTPDVEETFDFNTELNKNNINKHHDIYNCYGIKYIIIDDISVFRMKDSNLNSMEIRTDEFEGFTTEDYRIACGFLDGIDPPFYVFPLSESKLNSLIPSFHFTEYLYKWLYSVKDNKGYIAPRSYFINEYVSEMLFEDCEVLPSAFNIHQCSDLNEYHEKRSTQFFIELQKNNRTKPKHNNIYKSFYEFQNNNENVISFEHLNKPSKTPFIVLSYNNNEILYKYAPDNSSNDEDFLHGYLIATEELKTKGNK